MNYIKLLINLLHPKAILDVGAYYFNNNHSDGKPNGYVESVKHINKDVKVLQLLEENSDYFDALKIIAKNAEVKNKFSINIENSTIAEFKTTKKFDLIICQNILHFINEKNINVVFEKLIALLLPNGYLYIRTKLPDKILQNGQQFIDSDEKIRYVHNYYQLKQKYGLTNLYESKIEIDNSNYENFIYQKQN